MNFRQIIWLAALLAAQALVLSLLHTGMAQAETVYRCGGTYQQQPCAPGSPAAVMEVRDARSGAQVAQARQQSESEVQAFRQFVRHRQHEIHELPAAKAQALSAAHSGDGPFDHGPALSDAKAKQAQATDTPFERRHRRRHVRVAKVPRPNPAQQAAAGSVMARP